MKFPKEDLIELVYEDEPEGYTIIDGPNVSNTSRWSVFYETTFKHNDKFYKTTYSVGATEQQDESPYENEDDEIECVEVYPHQVTKTIYTTTK